MASSIDDDDSYLSSDLSSNDNNSESSDKNLKLHLDNIRDWSLTCNISHASIDKLLHILQKNKIGYMPLTARTLLQTNYNVITKVVSGMDYFNLRIKNQLQNLTVMYDKWEKIKVFPISLNIDGMSPFNSSSKSLWPILLSINIRPYQVCAIVITYGKSNQPITNL